MDFKALNSCVSTSDEALHVFRAAADGDNKENVTQRGSSLSLENSSHIVKTAIRSCRCGAAAAAGRGASSERPWVTARWWLAAPPAHPRCTRQMDAQSGWLQKPLFISTYYIVQREQREEGAVQRKDGPVLTAGQQANRCLLSLSLCAGGPTQTCAFTPPLGSGAGDTNRCAGRAQPA